MSKRGNRGQSAPYSISQNFLTSKRIIERLLRIADIGQTDIVLEIGAGKGHITKALADVGGRVISYEIDRVLYERLAPQLPENVKLYCRDFLESALPKKPYKVFANIPFSRTTEILRKLTRTQNLPDAMWLIMEKGAAKRFCGLPRETLNSLLLKPVFDTKIVYYFRREDFHPAPRVDVVMLELRKKSIPDIAPAEMKGFANFVMHSLQYGLFGRRALLTKRQMAAALKRAGPPLIGPSDQMLYVQWLCLFRCWSAFGKRIPKQKKHF